MKKKEKRGLLILILVSILIIGSIWFMARDNNTNEKEKNPQINTGYVQVQADGTKVNTSEKVAETRQIDGIVIRDIRLEQSNGITRLIADLTNTTGQAKDRFLVDIQLFDKSGKQIGTIPGIVGKTQPGETIQMQVGITEDFVGAYDFKIVKK